MRKKTFSIIAIFMIILSMCSFKIPKQTNEFYVNDFSNVLTNQDKEYILTNSNLIFNNDKTQIVVTTVPTLEGRSIEEYSLEMARQYKIGGSEKDNGLLILLATEDRKIRVEVGNGLEGVLNDAKCGRLIDDYAISYLKDNNFSEGILNLYKAVVNEIGIEGVDKPSEDDSDFMIGVVTIIIIFIGAAFIIFGGKGGRGKGRMVFIPSGRNYGGNSTFGGGFGGSSGGFGGSSGGGGSFGGGGSSRGF